MFSSIMRLLNAVYRAVKRWMRWGVSRVRQVVSMLTGGRVVLVAGPVVIGYAFSEMLLAEFPLRLAASLLFGAYATLLVRDMSFDTEEPKVSIGQFRIAEDLRQTAVATTLAMLTALMAAKRVAFAVVALVLLFAVYSWRLMPEGAVYRRFREIPVVGEALLASTLSAFLVFALFFYNQLAAGPELLVILFILAARFMIWFVLPEEKEEEDELELGEPEPPSTMVSVYGGAKTKNVLMGLGAVSTVLFYTLVATGYLHGIAWFSGIAYLAGFALVGYMTPENKASVAAAIPVLDTYIFALLTGLGWAIYVYVLEVPIV